MNDWMPVCVVVCIVLGTYLLHSTLAFLLTEGILNRTRWVAHPELRVLAWKLALVLPVASAFALTFWDVPHLGVQFPVPIAFSDQTDGSDAAASLVSRPQLVSDSVVTGESDESTTPVAMKMNEPTEGQTDENPTEATAATPPFVFHWLVAGVVAAWLAAVIFGFGQLGIQIWRLRRLRWDASPVAVPEFVQALRRLQSCFGIRRRVALLESSAVRGPMTAGYWRPFILLPRGVRWDLATHRDALLAHELVHIRRGDAVWNLVIQLLCRAFPFQPLQWWAGRQLRRESDFVADMLAARTSEARLALAQTLIRLGDQLVAATPPGHSSLAACMASFDSTLGRRIEVLLEDNAVRRPASCAGRAAIVLLMAAGTAVAVTAAPRAVADRTNRLPENNSPALSKNPSLSGNPALSRNPAMNKHISTVAVLVGLAMPAAAEEPQEKQPAAAATQLDEKSTTKNLKTTPDPIPDGISGFNGMLVGRLTAKDAEKGTFIVQVDAVPRVWRNNKAENPKSIVGKTVQVTGVFGRFLDVLVVTRPGETVEFECKHDGERLVFPGELLRKVAAYDPSDYPPLPEAFRGFQGAVAATVIKKDPETFELIVQIDRVMDTWQNNKAKEAKSAEGKPLMLAGFWNRKDAYHGLKVGDKIEVGMQHIELRSDHLNVAEFVRKAGERTERRPERRDEPKKESESSADSGMKKELRGFRGMLVGRLVEKDVERGTFTITVDAVPRVWNNNKSTSPKSFLGTNVTAEGVSGKMLDALVVAKPGDTIEFGALHDDGSRMRVGEVLRKVAPVQPGDYPVLPDDFRGFKGFVIAKVIRKDDQLLDMIVEITAIKSALPASRAKNAESVIGKQVMLAGFWQRKDAFHSISVGDTIGCGIEHPQLLSDHLSVIESLNKVESK
jgi:beta-lactamase regulating signal transducer with metallopeptidase domain